jgi:hypothetical protein
MCRTAALACAARAAVKPSAAAAHHEATLDVVAVLESPGPDLFDAGAGKAWRAHDVAGGVDGWVGGLQVPVHRHPPVLVRLHTHSLQPKDPRVREPARRRHQHLVYTPKFSHVTVYIVESQYFNLILVIMLCRFAEAQVHHHLKTSEMWHKAVSMVTSVDI